MAGKCDLVFLVVVVLLLLLLVVVVVVVKEYNGSLSNDIYIRV